MKTDICVSRECEQEKRDEGHVLRRMLHAPAPGKDGKEDKKNRWKDSCKRYMGMTKWN